MVRYFFAILIALSIIFPVIAQDDQDDDEGVLIGEAPITEISVDESDGIIITIMGELLESCVTVGDVTQSVEDDTINILVQTERPEDAMCAQAIEPFEITYELDTSDIEAGDYTLDVNGVTEPITIVANAESQTVEFTCPEPDDETVLFDDLGVCFVYPMAFSELSGTDFIFISQPLTSNAVLLIEITSAEETTLADMQDDFDADEILAEELVIGGQSALIVETDDMRSAFIIANDQLYSIFVQPIVDDEDTGELLWATVIDSIFFPESDEE